MKQPDVTYPRGQLRLSQSDMNRLLPFAEKHHLTFAATVVPDRGIWPQLNDQAVTHLSSHRLIVPRGRSDDLHSDNYDEGPFELVKKGRKTKGEHIMASGDVAPWEITLEWLSAGKEKFKHSSLPVPLVIIGVFDWILSNEGIH